MSRHSREECAFLGVRKKRSWFSDRCSLVSMRKCTHAFKKGEKLSTGLGGDLCLWDMSFESSGEVCGKSVMSQIIFLDE